MNKLWDIHNNLFKIKNNMYAILKFLHEVRYHLKYIIENEQTKTMLLILKYIGEPKSKIFY